MASQKAIALFQNKIYAYYRQNRRSFPWRDTRDPYAIFLSEVMLQQTQTIRVVEKYTAFLRVFPTVASLAAASVAEVLRHWQGLGYNRRALFLKKAAERIVTEHSGVIPSDTELLDELPGIGSATAASIATFAFNRPTIFIETNIRTVFIDHFFKGKNEVNDDAIFPLVEKTRDMKNPREWYYALMDYGAMLKKKYPNPNRKSAHYTKQSRFEGSNRQIRGMILRILLKETPQTENKLMQKIKKPKARLQKIIKELMREGFITSDGTSVVLAEKRL